MAFGFDKRVILRAAPAARTGAEAAAIDAGLRQHMLRVYNYMASGLALTGIVAYLVGTMPALQQLFWTVAGRGVVAPTGLGWLAMLSPLAFVLVLSFGVHRLSAGALQGVFWAFAAAMGLSMSNIFLVFTGTSITRVFFIAGATFAAMSLYGYTTRRDLSGFGSFLIMGLVGIIIASIVNLFMQSTALHFVVSAIGVLVFVGLTAYDTQQIKSIYLESDGPEVAGKKAIMGAVSLYLDFINLFMLLLQFFGQRRD